MSEFNEEYRFGSARWPTTEEKQPLHRADGLVLGFAERGNILRHPSDGPMLMIAGSGAGKAVSGGLMYNLCTFPGSVLAVDFKGELASVSIAAQAPLGKYAYCINPAEILNLPNHSTDPLDILKADARSLVPDAKMIAEMLVSLSGSTNGKHFEDTGRLVLAAIMIADVEVRGTGSLLTLYELINSIEGNSTLWSNFLRCMQTSSYANVRSMAGDLIYKQEHAPKEFSGIVGEAKKALSFLDDPNIQRGLERPDFSLKVLCERRCNVYINIPAEYIGIWSPYIRLLIGTAMNYKQRNPDKPRVVFMVDEAGQLGKAEFLMRAMTFGRGAGILTQAVFQSVGQISAHYGREGAQTFMSSAVVQQWFGVRDWETAELLSKTLGTETLSFNAALDQSAARRNKAKIMRRLLAGGDPFEIGLDDAQESLAAVNRTQQVRALMTGDEILRMPADRQIIQASGINCPPAAEWREAYFQRRELAGKFMPNPYHPPLDRVRVKTFFGSSWRRVITERVPEKYADFPQYASGEWSYIEGYRPS